MIRHPQTHERLVAAMRAKARRIGILVTPGGIPFAWPPQPGARIVEIDQGDGTIELALQVPA